MTFNIWIYFETFYYSPHPGHTSLPPFSYFWFFLPWYSTISFIPWLSQTPNSYCHIAPFLLPLVLVNCSNKWACGCAWYGNQLEIKILVVIIEHDDETFFIYFFKQKPKKGLTVRGFFNNQPIRKICDINPELFDWIECRKYATSLIWSWMCKYLTISFIVSKIVRW